ncbi:Rib/alpha-like domain-containing protein [Streptococcus mitis]|uniref:Rib/alpha-like domain-containing protein n=1 Tax=Streptococcus mitis TaxID=28037 RepID=UPI0039C120D4
MYSRMDKYHGQKVQRFSIRKYSFGAASVAVAAYMMFGGAATVQAQEPGTSATVTSEQVNSDAGNQADSTKPVASTETSTSTVEAQTAEQLATSAPEAAPAETPKAAEAPAETPKAAEAPTETPKADTSKLEAAIARLEAALAKAASTEKTASAIESAKAALASAKAVVANEAATKEEVAKATSAVNGKAFVIESMPKATADKKEEKVNKNQDPRNGQAIPGKGESGFRGDTATNDATGTSSNDAAATSTTTTGTSDTITPTNPAKPTAKDIIGSTSTVSRENFTGWDTYTMPFGSHHDGEGDLGVNTQEKKADAAGLEFRVFSDQRADTRPSPGPSNYTYNGKENDVKGRIDYGLKLPAAEVQKLIEEAPLWRGKLKYNNTRISSQVAATYYGNGPYEYLLSSIYKLGYEQGIDKVYVKDASKRIEVTKKAKAAGWTVSDFTVSNMPGGLVYDKQSDSIQGVVTHSSPFNYQKLVATVTFTNTKTGKNVRIPLDLHRYGGTAWKDGTPPTLEINDAVKEGKVGEELVVPVEYRDAGASHAGAPNGRDIPYSLTDENGNPLNRTARIRETVGRAILGVSGVKITGTTGAGASTVTDLTGDDTKIPGVGFTIASNDMTERNKNGFKGTPTEAGIYRVSIYARDYKETNANEAYAHATFKISPAVSVKNVHAYDKEVPITISRGASEATITLPDGTNTKVVAKDGKWVVTETTNTAVNVNDEIGTVGETFNLKVLPTATAKAATDNIKVTASSENVTATFTRAEVALKTKLGENVTATFNKSTGRWDLPAKIAEKKTVNSDGKTTWLKRDLYVDVDKNGETIFNVYEYTRTLNAEGKVTAVSDPTRTLTTYKKENTANSSATSATDTNKGMVVTVRYDKGLDKWTADDNSTVTATKTGDKWTISTTSGFNGTVDVVQTASSSDKASVLNDAPSISSTSYTTVKGATVDLVKQKSATVTITDREDDATTAPNKKETTVTKVTLTSPSGTVTEYSSAAEAAAVKLSEVGTYTVKVEVKDSNGNVVTADTETDTGTNKGADTAVNSTTYKITVKDQETNKLYTVEGDTVTNDQLKEKVNPTAVDGFTSTKNDITDLPATSGQAGKTLSTPATITYTKDTETIQVETKVDVVVLPKVTPTGVTVLKDSTGLEEAVKAKAVEAANAVPTDKLPDGVTVSVKEVKQGTVPATTATGVQTPATVVVEYLKDGKVVASREVTVPVTVVGSTAKKLVVFEGDTVTKDDVKGAVTEGTDGTKGEPVIADDITATSGNKEVTVPVTYDNGKLTETVKVPVTVLPKPEADEILVPKNGNKEKAKEKVLAQAEKAIADGTFTGKLPQGARVEIDKTAPVTVPDLTDDTEVDVTVKYTVDGEVKTTTVTVPVTVVEGVPQIVPVDENNKQPDPEKSIDKTDYPEGSTFRYKTPDGQTSPIDVTTTGDKNVIVEVLDKDGNPIAEVPATVRVVESYPQFVPVDKDNKQPAVEGSIDPKAFPKETEFSYETPVDTTTPGEKDVVVVAKIGDKVIAKVPAKVMVVEPKTQYVPVDKSNKQPDASKSVDPEQYPDGVTFKYKTPVDTTTLGEKDVIVEAKDGEDKLVEVPAKVKVVEGKEQLIPVNPTEKPQARDSITPSDYPEGSTFEYKVPEGQKEPFDATTVGDKPVTVVVKDKNGNVLVEVPATIKVVEAKPTPIETPVTNTPLTKEDIAKFVKVPEGGKVTNVENIPDLTTPGEKDPVKVTVELPNGKVITVDVPVNVTPVNEIETPVTNTPLTPEDYTKGITIPEGGKVTNVENIPDLTTPGKKDPVKVTVELPNGKVITVEVPVNVTPVKEIETPVTSTPLTPEDYTKGIKIPEGGKVTNVENIPDLTTPGKKDPVKVTITLPNGKVVTVEVPVNVTPITPIETPITKEKLTPEDVLKQIKIPEGATVKVGDLPDLTTPGKKDPVKVTITLPNGKIVTVEVPVNVTPIEDIVKKQGDPITAEDVEKHIPKGVKVISIGDKPTTDIPGERPSIPVVIELPNGIRVTMNIPVIVTPKVTPVVVQVGTPVTPEDVQKHIELPNGWKVTKVGEIPTTTTPGTKPVVPVEIELPDGRKITVDVPVIVTPTVRQIVVPQGTPITPDDVKGHIDLPKEPGWEIIEVGEIPTTIPAGVKPSVKVKIKVPTGEIIEVEVPIIVTPTVTPIVVEVGTPITKEDVIKKVGLPEGWEIVEVGEIPTTETPGTKPVVKVKIKLPDGRIITVEVPVTVTPKSQNGGGVISQNGDSTVQIVTEYLDENGNRITSDKEGKHNPIELEGYEFSHSTTDAKGNTLHHYKKVKKPINQEQPSSPETPTSPEKPVATPVQTSSTDSKPVAVETAEANDKKELPNTGTEANASLAALGLLGALSGFGLLARKKKED